MGSAGVDDVIVPFVEEGRGNGDCTGDDGENVGGKVLCGEFGEEGRRLRGMLGGLRVNHKHKDQ